jgi:hypothetical protein
MFDWDKTKTAKISRFVLLLLALAVVPLAARAQGCALCYQSAAAAGPRAIKALRNGIVILIIPPMFVCSAITLLVYRRRNLHDNNS